uniref:Uncharacterized protein n=1 Tax=Bracoviriform kariyai TaxID=199362 RepID=Q8B6C9_9VIRU|nr:hypothetical protein [Bracoviriform kariyai]
MLFVIIVTLFIISNVIPKIRAAEEQEDQKAQLNGMQTSVYEGGNVIKTIKVQRRDTLNIVSESYVEQTNHADESQSSNRLRRDLNFDNFMKDFIKDEIKEPFNNISNRTGSGISYSVQTYQRNKPIFKGNFKGRNVVSGSLDESIGNTFYDSNPNASVVVQIGNTYSENSKNKNTKNNTENQVNTAKQNATDSQGNSSSTNYNSSSHIENNTLYNKGSEAYANNQTAFNRQMILSSNVFYLFLYSSMILLKYSLF